MTRQGKGNQGKARQDKARARQYKARQDKARARIGKARARQGKARQGKARQGKAWQGMASEGKAKERPRNGQGQAMLSYVAPNQNFAPKRERAAKAKGKIRVLLECSAKSYFPSLFNTKTSIL
jgi:hypothetical protein